MKSPSPPNTLIKLQRYDEARREILRAIECLKPFGHAAKPWKTWNILRRLEAATGNAEAAEKAREKALKAYLAYRRDGGENTGQMTLHNVFLTNTLF